MFGRRFKLFELLGFSVYIDLSWLVIALLVTWSLATGIFPAYVKDLSAPTYWTMGAACALGLFASIVFHEFAHSLVARRRGIRMQGITLFIFGGVAEMRDEPPNPAAEFWVAIAGPIASVVLAVFCVGLEQVGHATGVAAPAVGVVAYLAWINFMLALFNMIPAFPLDGGRVLRSLLWAWKQDLRRATRVVSRIGAVFGLVLVGLGAFSFITGSIIAGVWWFILGLFLRQAAKMSYQQLLMRQALEGEPVRRFMNPQAITVPPSLTIQSFVDDFVYRHHHKLYPVVEQDQLLGCVSVEQIKQIPRAEWPQRTINDLVNVCTEENTIDADADAIRALSKMSRNHASRLIVVDGKAQLAGVLALKDLLKFLSLKVELEMG